MPGWGAHGTFTVTHDITKFTKAKIFSQIGKKTEMLARFSTVAGELGAADAERDVRGFALKFYSEEGNWDMVGKKYAGLLYPRSLQVSRFHPYAEAPSAHQHALADRNVGLVVAVT
jgi:hypothetical protein